MKFKNRIELAQYFKNLGFKRGAEIGVADGRYSRILMETIPGLALIGVDPYRAYDGYTDFRRESTFVNQLLQAREKLKSSEGYALLVTSSEQAAKWVADNSLDFVFIDANHQYEFVKQDLALWVPKVRLGGIVSGHDYYHFRSGRGGVVQAVDEFVAANDYQLQTTERDPEAHRDDQQPDWWFFR